MKLSIEFNNEGALKHFESIDDTKKKSVGENGVISKYGKTFDSKNLMWDSEDMEFNLGFIRAVQFVANETLQTDGVLILNDLYDLLGFERTKLGAVTGWTYNKGNPNADNKVYIDVIKIEGEDTILLDFNVDGFILNYLKD